MIFGLGETASGAVGLAAFGATMERATPLVVSSEIRYTRLAKGPLTAVAELTRPAAEVIAELDAGSRPEFAVEVTVTDARGSRDHPDDRPLDAAPEPRGGPATVGATCRPCTW